MGRIFLIIMSLCTLLIADFHKIHGNERTYNQFDRNPHLNHKMRKKMRPYLLPHNHPAKPLLDHLFLYSRVLLNPTTFEAAGFITLHTKSRSFIRVARHPNLPGYLIKIYLDSEVRSKNGKPGWEWLVARCKGAAQVRNAIKQQKSKFFQAPHKWLYPLPPEPSPIDSPDYVRQPVILIVEDMDLVSDEDTFYAWANQVNREHLNELYRIISKAKGSSYRPDNICLSRNGKFSFIDTEYPNQKTDYNSMRMYLSPEMRHYWDKLVKKGGAAKTK